MPTAMVHAGDDENLVVTDLARIRNTIGGLVQIGDAQKGKLNKIRGGRETRTKFKSRSNVERSRSRLASPTLIMP